MGFRRGEIDHGEMAEWSIAAVLKTVELRGSGGSNPSLSAIKGVNQRVARFTPFLHPRISRCYSSYSASESPIEAFALEMQSLEAKA